MEIRTAFETLRETLLPLYGEREAATVARYILEDAFGVKNLNQKLEFNEEKTLQILGFSQRLAVFEPWQHLVGLADFGGLKMKVTPDVLIPRPETEELVALIVEDFEGKSPKILDIGTGTGCIPIALKKHLPEAVVSGVDVSEKAVQIAYQNAVLNKTEVTFLQIDILEKEHWKLLPIYDLVVSNPPYIPEKDKKMMSQNVLEYEPSLALFVPNETPLIFYETIADFALAHLQPKAGRLYFEIHEDFGEEVRILLEKKGFREVVVFQDMNNKNRMIRAFAPL